jgi:hypothetical protein
VADRNGTWIQLTNATSWLNRSADLCRQHFFRVHVEYDDLQCEFGSMRLSKVERFDDRDQLRRLLWSPTPAPSRLVSKVTLGQTDPLAYLPKSPYAINTH